MNLNVQTKTATTSTTKLAVAFAFLGAAALAAAAASMPTAKLAGDYGYGYQPPVLPISNDQPDIKRFDMQIVGDKVVYVTNSFSHQNMSLDQNSNGNTFTKTSDKAQAILQITPTVYQGKSPVSYGFGVVYNQFPAPKFNGEVNPFAIEVLNKGVLTWSSKPRVSLTLDPVLSKTGYMTFFVLIKNEDGVHMIPEVAADDFTYIIMKNASTEPVVSPPTSTQGIVTVLIENAYDMTTLDRILTPSVTPVQIGKWKLTAQTSPVSLNTVTFQLIDEKGKLVTDSKDFGPFTLYNAADMNNPLAMSTYIPGPGRGLVQFKGNKMVVIKPDQPVYLILKATVNGSGVMKPNSIRNWVMRVTAPSSVRFSDYQNGTELTNKQIILATSTMITAPGISASHNYNLLHNAAPVITAVNSGFNLELNPNAQLFKFTVYNPGDREMRLGSFGLTVSASGLTGSNGSNGSVGNWRLWTTNSTGGLGSNLAVTSTCALVGVKGLPGCTYNVATGNVITVTFDNTSQVNKAMDNLIIPAGTSLTFIMTADTTNIVNGKIAGSVVVAVRLDGDTGFNRQNATWYTGPVQYYYTPVGGKEVGPYAHSDSYDITGNYLVRTL